MNKLLDTVYYVGAVVFGIVYIAGWAVYVLYELSKVPS